MDSTAQKDSIAEAGNPLEPHDPLQNHAASDSHDAIVHPQTVPYAEDSAVTKAEKIERHGLTQENEISAQGANKDEGQNLDSVRSVKRRRIETNGSKDTGDEDTAKIQQPVASASAQNAAPETLALPSTQVDKFAQVPARIKGIAPIKAEYLISAPGSGSRRDHQNRVDQDLAGQSTQNQQQNGQRHERHETDDDAAEGAAHHGNQKTQTNGPGKKQKSQGQNHARDFGSSKDERGLCQSRANRAEFSPEQCQYGESCRFEHDLRLYLKDWKRGDLETFGGKCPVLDARGTCDAGWKCRFVGSHMLEREVADGRKELVLLDKQGSIAGEALNGTVRAEENKGTNINEVSTQAKADLARRRTKTPRADEYTKWIEESGKIQAANEGPAAKEAAAQENRAQYVEPPFLPSEKRRLYFGPETPVLAPLTTQGNLPFRRLCVELGAQATYSEMAMSLPLIQGQKSEWALLRGHQSESNPPAFSPTKSEKIVSGYENSKDIKFGAQIAANKAWQALKATEILTALCPSLRVIDLNCGCPIDLVYRQGAGSALLDSPSKLEKILRGMNAVSGHVPISAKIRMGTKDGRPTAIKLTDRLIYGGQEATEHDQGGCGVAAITLHGRSRQQRYTRSADWEYIAECAAVVNSYNEKRTRLQDTAHEPDSRNLPASATPSSTSDSPQYTYFLGNGDCYSHVDYADHLAQSKVDSVMVARGALIKPWIFEEIATGQYLDKSASERLGYVEKYARFGLETWGSDERGVGTTRRFLLEWLSFAYRYVPLGILEHLPPRLQDRPPAYRGRSDLETLLSSDNYKDWIKISEMFLGPAHKDFRFQPKHKSNSYEIEAEG